MLLPALPKNFWKLNQQHLQNLESTFASRELQKEEEEKRKLDKSRKELTLCMHSQEKKLATTFGTEMVKLEVTSGLWKILGKDMSRQHMKQP